MKTIRKGKLRDRRLRTTCRYCSSVLEEQESKLDWEHDRDGDLAREKCPECSGEIIFYRK